MDAVAVDQPRTGSGFVPLQAKPLAGSAGAALITSLCCGGSLVFASIGLGALYSSLGLGRYVPQFLAGGTVAIVAMNWLLYRRKAQRGDLPCSSAALRRTMFLSTFLGLAMMVGGFLFLDWLTHGVVNAARFMTRPEYAEALIPGVKNQNLIYALLSFVGLALLAALPFPSQAAGGEEQTTLEAAPSKS